MTPPRPADKATWVLGLLGILMVSHLIFLGFGAKHCHDLVTRDPSTITEQCNNSTDIFQRAAETYIAILLALMAPLSRK